MTSDTIRQASNAAYPLDSNRGGPAKVFWQSADGTGSPELLTAGPNPQFPNTISPNGLHLVFRDDSPDTGQDLMLLTLEAERRVESLIRTPFNELNAEISPDGQWIAYESNESGPYEIYVRPFPDVTAGQWLISTGGGTRPLWAHTGQELFYLAPTGALMGVRVEQAPTFAAGTPTALVEAGYYAGGSINAGRTYDVSRDGERFLMLKVDASTSADLVIVLNWTEELKRLIPAN